MDGYGVSEDFEDNEMIIRVRLGRAIVERIDKMVGKSRRNQFVLEAILWRLDLQDPLSIPPTVVGIMDELEELKKRVEYLETLHSSSAYDAQLSKTIKTKVCRDSLDVQLLTFLLRNNGSTTKELAQAVGKEGKRRTIYDRLMRLNERAIKVVGKPIIHFEKGMFQGKSNSWWIKDISLLTE